ncbi:MAG TPA: hypothetical protein ENF48_04165, partial [Desulfobacteraceae bacterium]|nr:hypothetical protein [Desulfobacteraceae bacterium]
MSFRPSSKDPPGVPDAVVHRTVLSVSQLTIDIKQLLEEKFEFIWITGEISNFKIPASGHA